MTRYTLLLLACLWRVGAEARDDAPLSHMAETEGCPSIPSSISLDESCNACQYLKVTSICPVEYYHIDIYDRAGASVYSSDRMDQAWDGSAGRAYLPVGCYSYHILYRTDASGVLHLLDGTVVFLH